MTIRQYIKKVKGICDYFDETEQCGADCPMFKYDCGLPKENKMIAPCIEFVEQFEIPKTVNSDNAIQQIVFCKDCIYRNTADCTAKHERADLDFCSKGRTDKETQEAAV